MSAQPDGRPPTAVAPAGRYGRAPSPVRRAVLIGLITLLAAAFVGFVLWAALARVDDPRWQLRSFRVDGNLVYVEADVVADPARTVQCDVVAQNRWHETVGVRTGEVGPGPRRRLLVVDVPTREPAVAVVVETCTLR